MSVIVSVYNKRNNWGIFEEVIKRMVEEYKEDHVIIKGDLNARIGEECGNDVQGWNVRRKSKDKKVNNKGKELVKLIGEIGGYILNGVVEKDRKGEFTYVGPRNSSVIDFIVTNEIYYENVNKFKVVSRVDSDHMPIVMTTKGENTGGKRLEKRVKTLHTKEKDRFKFFWSKETVLVYKERTDSVR